MADLKKNLGHTAEELDAHLDNIANHITAEERAKWDATTEKINNTALTVKAYNNSTSGTYFKIAELDCASAGTSNHSVVFDIVNVPATDAQTSFYAKAMAVVRYTNGAFDRCFARIINNNGVSPEDVIIAYNDTDGKAELWIKNTVNYQTVKVYIRDVMYSATTDYTYINVTAKATGTTAITDGYTAVTATETV